MEKFKIKRLAFTILVIFFSASLFSAQNLAEVAKKERERRAALRAQGKTSIIVTNADLKKRYKSPVVSAESASPTPQRKTRPRPTPPPRASERRAPQLADQQRDQSSDGYMDSKYATKVLLSSELIKNPEFALKKPDGKFAELSFQGVLELEVNIKNGPGDDIAVYSRMSGTQEAMSRGEGEGGIPETLEIGLNEGVWYGVMAMSKNGEWEVLGRGRARSVSDKFDLGGMSSTNKIRIIFKPLNNPDLPVKRRRSNSRELTCGIDAVEILQ